VHICIGTDSDFDVKLSVLQKVPPLVLLPTWSCFVHFICNRVMLTALEAGLGTTYARVVATLDYEAHTLSLATLRFSVPSLCNRALAAGTDARLVKEPAC